ncbi:MAG: CotH kinase family protein [Kiritimatiellae bacterium]|nr:CotH kinase family protein [Kiritimatiellia bacterium]
MRIALMSAAVSCAAALAETPFGPPSFSAEFGAYAVGETLGAKGTTGGDWTLADEASATNVVDGGVSAMSLVGTARFTAAEAPTGNVERIDFSILIGDLETGRPAAISAAGALLPAMVDGVAGYYGWGDGRWNGLSADGAQPCRGEWLYGRLETKEVEGIRLVSYLVRRSGGEYVRCAGADGRTWFRAGAAAERREVSFVGSGLFAKMEGTSAQEESGPVYYWTGGASGSWGDPSCWSTNGVAGAGVPGAGSYAFVTNSVAMTNGEECAVIDFLAVRDGADVVGGDFATEVSLDVSRPRAGRTLAPAFGTFLGAAPNYDFLWERADYLKASFSEICREPSFTPHEDDYCHWIRFAVSRGGNTEYARTFYFSSLPVCYMATDDGQTPTASKEKHEGTLFVQGNDSFKMQYDGAMTVNVRGNSSKGYPKKPYKIKLAEKAKMFGLGEKKNKHWVLLANYNDLSQTRNKLPYDFAREIGGLGMRSTWVDCVLNGKLLGTYQFCEHIRIASDRVNIYDWEDAAEEYGATETDLSVIDAALEADPGSIDITGGYLFEFSNEADEITCFDVTAGSLTMHTMANRPEYLNTSAKMLACSKNYLQNYFSAITSWDGCTADGRHWSELCDVDSMVDFFLVNELFDNGDMGQKSRYAYIDRGGKLTWGPVWDYDWGSYSRTVPNTCERWRSAGGGEANMNREWTSDPWFCLRVWERYREVRGRYAATYADGGTFDQAVAAVRRSAEVDERLWAPRKDTANVTRTFDGDVAILKDFHAKRLAWMDRQFADVATLMASLKNAYQTHSYVPDAFEIEPRIEEGRSVFTVSVRRAYRVKAILNGRVLGTFDVKGGEVRGRFAADALVVGNNRRNCLSLVAYDRIGRVVARNYALFNHVPKGFTIRFR